MRVMRVLEENCHFLPVPFSVLKGRGDLVRGDGPKRVQGWKSTTTETSAGRWRLPWTLNADLNGILPGSTSAEPTDAVDAQEKHYGVQI